MNKKASTRRRSSNGEICISSDRKKLRIHIPSKNFADRKQRFLSLRLEDTQVNRLKAKHIILAIEEDIFLNQFDESLDKYRESIGVKKRGLATIQVIWQEYLN